MQQGQKSSKKWVDYSDQSEEQFDHQPSLKATQSTPVSSQGHQEARDTIVDHRSPQFIQQQMKRLQDARQRYTEIWVLLESDEQWALDKKMRDLKDNPNKDVLNVYMSKDVKGGWDVKVLDVALELWIKEGIDPQRHIRVTVSDRNFRKRTETGDRPRGDGRRGGGRGGGRGGRGGDRGRGGRQRGGDREGGDTRGPRRQHNPNEPKKVYVDKNTGSLPNNKVETEQKVIQEKQRHYTKQEAEKVGEGLGNFRNKTKGDNPPVEVVRVEPVRVEAPRKPKEEVRPWARKEKSPPKNEEKEERRQEIRQEEAPKPEERKKKQYVLVDKPKEATKEEKPSKKEKDLLSEDSN